MVRGDAKGIFLDLEMLVDIAIDHNGDSDCPTRLSNEMSHWINWTINKPDTTTSQDKWLALVTEHVQSIPKYNAGSGWQPLVGKPLERLHEQLPFTDEEGGMI